ncbi:MAG: hypothetical protein Q4B54_11450 [Coriobacteriales bacterium]|nr:hypothetical protein [Coriobacteriales bacterium]
MSKIEGQTIDNELDNDLNDEEDEQVAGGETFRLPMSPIEEEHLSQRLLWKRKQKHPDQPSVFG